MTKIINRYFDENLQHWVDVYESKKDNHRPRMSVKWQHRMKGSERKLVYDKDSVEDNLRQETERFIIRKETEKT